MLRKIINIKTFSTVSFLSAFLGLALFFVYKSFTFSPYVINDLSKNVVLLSLTILSLLFYVLSLIKNKNVNVINNKYVRILFILLSIVIILSSLFSGEFKNAFLGKYIFSQSGLTYISIIILSYLSIINLKRNKALA